MKNAILHSLIILTSVALAAPSVTIDSVAHDTVTGRIVVSYTISDEPAIITFVASTNGVAIPPVEQACAYGAINRYMDVGEHKFAWKPNLVDFAGALEAGTGKVTVKAWTKEAPPAYLAINLLHPEIKRFYDTAEEFPGGITNVIYKTDWLVFRRVAAKENLWRRGDWPTFPQNYQWSDPIYNKVWFTDDFYLAVFELTQSQYNVAQSQYLASWYTFAEATMAKPKLKQTAYEFRGQVLYPAEAVNILPKMRAYIGLQGLDLPTEAQWEYAARAGKPTLWFFGSTGADIGEYAWWSENSNSDTGEEVGLKKPNPWGFYDIYGNASESILETGGGLFYGLGTGNASDASFVATNPAGSATASWAGVVCGGSARSTEVKQLSNCSQGGYTAAGGVESMAGVRLCAPVSNQTFAPDAEDGLTLTATDGAVAKLVDGATTMTVQTGRVRVDYKLAGAAAVVTLDIETNGVSIGVAALRDASGDVNKLVQPGARSISWKPHRAFSGSPSVLTNARAVMKVWPATNPPDYLVVDIASGEKRYYVSAEAIPGGLVDAPGDVINDPYRRTNLVMRRMHVEGLVWMMGEHYGKETSTGSGVYLNDYDVYYRYPRMVTLSSDFYLGIYEFTQGQYKSLMGGVLPKDEAFTEFENSDVLPVNMLTVEQIRGNLDWPTNTAVGASSPMGVLRSRTSLDFDLPTEAQWEFAARNGGNLTYGRRATASGLDACEWYGQTEPKSVGTKQPNGYGLYDMLGNATEWTLLWCCNSTYSGSVWDSTKVLIDPVVKFENALKASDGSGYRVSRGGSYNSTADMLQCTLHGGSRSGSEVIGFRVACPAVAK